MKTLPLKSKDSIPDDIRVEIKFGHGEFYFDFDSLAVACEGDPSFLLKMEPTAEVSALSGDPALIYITKDVSIPLTGSEIRRMVRRCLAPAQYQALKGEVGIFYDVNDDFYDPDNGFALRPVDDEEYSEVLREAQELIEKKMDIIALARVSTLLLSGKVDSAEEVVSQMRHPEKAQEKIDKFKETYAGLPHGQWKG